jgi:hypothetical protein
MHLHQKRELGFVYSLILSLIFAFGKLTPVGFFYTIRSFLINHSMAAVDFLMSMLILPRHPVFTNPG